MRDFLPFLKSNNHSSSIGFSQILSKMGHILCVWQSLKTENRVIFGGTRKNEFRMLITHYFLRKKWTLWAPSWGRFPKTIVKIQNKHSHLDLARAAYHPILLVLKYLILSKTLSSMIWLMPTWYKSFEVV